MVDINPDNTILPDAEFDIMKVIWQNPVPITTKNILLIINQTQHKDWNLSTLQTLLTRLIKRGFLFSDKLGKERMYSPRVSLMQYQANDIGNFAAKYNKSFFDVITALVASNGIEQSEINELKQFLLSEESNDNFS